MKAYYYLFYKFYKFWEATSTPKFMSDWKAELSIDLLAIFLGFSCIVYYTVVSKEWIDLGDKKYIIPIYVLFIAMPNYFIFHHKGKWKHIIYEFDKWSNEKNRKGGIIVSIVVILIITNLFFSFYLLSQIDWKRYR